MKTFLILAAVIIFTSVPVVMNACSNVGFGPDGGGSNGLQSISGPQSINETVPQPMVDFVLIIDTSMTNANIIANLSNSLPLLFSAIPQSINWQACVITTDVTNANSPAGKDGATLSYAGQPLSWVGSVSGGSFFPISTTNPNVLNSQTPNLAAVLSNTAQYIQSSFISPGQGNAQGIGALYQMVSQYHTSSGCFRSGAVLASILISAKDENATYGSCNRALDGLSVRGLTAGPNENFCEPVAGYENPTTAKSFISSVIGTPFIFNSIIVQPGDAACLSTQTLPQPQLSTPNQTWYSPAFYGNQYVTMSTLTGGSTTSICAPANNYAGNLSSIGQAVSQTLGSVPLACAPTGTPQVTLTPSIATTMTVSGNVMSFNPALPAGTKITGSYNCN